MMYLSKGLLQDTEHNSEVRISYCGKVFVLGPKLAAMWNRARFAPQKAAPQENQAIRRLAQSGLVTTTEETGKLGVYWLFSNCIPCPEPEMKGRRPLLPRDRRIWEWLNKAGLHLTTCELIRLEEQHLTPTPELLGETHRQELTEAIYTAETISNGILEAAMEHSSACNTIVASLQRLLRSRYLYLS